MNMKFTSGLGILLVAMLVFTACKQDKGTQAAARAELENASAMATSEFDEIGAADQVPVGPLTTISFGETKHDFGMIPEGEKVAHLFKFTNTGKEPLVLNNVKASCGCTSPSWTKEPIAPGGQGEILVEFDSKGRPGKQTKTVTVTANTDPVNTILTITGDVEKAEES